MITRKNLEYYLTSTLGSPKFTHQGLSYCCPKCDSGKKYNLEINIDRNIFNCWSCRYSGVIRKLMSDYACENSWRSMSEFKQESKEGEEQEPVKELNFPKETVPFYLNGKVTKYLLEERGMDRRELIKRKVCYAYSQDELYYNHICFPFYENGHLVGACIQNFETKRYRNLGPLNFVPYKEYINVAYPITITEGCYDALSGINAIPILRTEPNKETLKFLSDKDVILAIDNTVDLDFYTKQMKLLEKTQVRSLTLFDLSTYKDLNEYSLKNAKGFSREYKNCFDKIVGKQD